LHWPGYWGLPFRGDQPPILSQKELHRLRLTADAWHATFDLSDEADAAYYNWVRDRARNGWFVIDFIQRWRDKKSKKVKVLVYCEWSQLYVQL
jgi:hypothetical protein